MNTPKPILTFTAFLMLVLSVSGQTPANTWYFGENAGLHFTSGQSQPLTNSALRSLEGCSAISDPISGQLLFYTNGEKVWNRNHRVMPGGSNIGGNTSSTQSALIVPAPGSGGRLYYVFTTSDLGGGNELTYSTIDMTADSRRGAVISSASTLMSSSSERMAASFHANKEDIWLVAHRYGSNDFHSFLIDGSGIVLSRISSTGLVDLSSSGCMKFSNSGKKLGMAFRTQNTYGLYDFNKSTGLVSATVQLPDSFHLSYGLEFSPDDSKLYFHRSKKYAANGSAIHEAELFQMNIAAASPSLMLASITKIGDFGVEHPGSFQLAPDGEIYISRFDAYELASIANPNFDASRCGFVDRRRSLLGKRCKFGLPNTIQQFFLPKPKLLFENNCQFDSIFCAARKLVAIDSIKWDFGDPASGVNNTKNGNTSFHIYSMAGDYIIKNIFYRGDYSDTIFQNIHITPKPYSPLGNDTSICPGTFLQLDARVSSSSLDTFRYEWMDGSRGFQLQTSSAQKYSVSISNHCGTAKDTIDLSFRSLPDANLGADVLLCEGDTGVLAPSLHKDATYLWSDGSHASKLRVQNAGVYWVHIKDACGVDVDSLTVELEGNLSIELGADTLLCDGATILLDAIPNQVRNNISFLWQDTSAMPNYLAGQKGLYHVLVRTDVCEATDSIYIDFLKSPEVNLGVDTILCTGQSLSLNAYHPLSIYAWENGNISSLRTVQHEGSYAVQVSNMCGWSVDTIEVLVYKDPKIDLGNDTVICLYRPVVLDARTEDMRGLTYLWQDGYQKAIREVTIGGEYIVIVLNHCGIDVDTIHIESRTENCECTAFVPNVFTPNNDGVNDEFAVDYPCLLSQYRLDIYDRWGQLVYGSADPNGSWNGYCRARACPPGIYYYVLNYKSHVGFVDNRSILKGHLTLVR